MGVALTIGLLHSGSFFHLATVADLRAVVPDLVDLYGPTEAAVEAPIEEGTDPRPDARTDPQPLRGPQPDGDEPKGTRP